MDHASGLPEKVVLSIGISLIRCCHYKPEATAVRRLEVIHGDWAAAPVFWGFQGQHC